MTGSKASHSVTEPKELIMRFLLKTGEECIIRDCRIGDEDGLYEAERTVVDEGPFMLTEPDELKGPSDIRLRLEKGLDPKRELMLVAQVGKTMVGQLRATRHAKRRDTHSARFGLFIIPRFRRLGIATNMMERLEEWAGENGVIRLELTVFDDNVPATELYKKMGFTEYGSVEKRFLVEGRLVGELFMGKWLKPPETLLARQ